MILLLLVSVGLGLSRIKGSHRLAKDVVLLLWTRSLASVRVCPDQVAMALVWRRAELLFLPLATHHLLNQPVRAKLRHLLPLEEGLVLCLLLSLLVPPPTGINFVVADLQESWGTLAWRFLRSVEVDVEALGLVKQP